MLLAGLPGGILHQAVSSDGCSALAREGTKCVRSHVPQLGYQAYLQGRSVLLSLSLSLPVPGSSLYQTSVCLS